jgi:hypothetical protein
MSEPAPLTILRVTRGYEIRAYIILVCMTLSFVCGCASKIDLVPVEGKLLVDGQPIDNVLVTFVPEAVIDRKPIRSMGISDREGRFQMRAETQELGAVVGEHRIILEDLAILDAPRSEDGTVTKLPPIRFPASFANPITSTLRATVTDGREPILIKVETRGQ